MRAVNLIPEDERRGAGGAAGRSGGAAYLLLGGLAIVVIMLAAFTLTGRTVSDRKTELARVERDAQAAEARAAQLQAYTTFASLRAKRVETVKSIASSRFDWSHAMHEIARVVPNDVWLTDLRGTVTPSVSLQSGAGGGAGSLRGALPNPAVELNGCTTSQDEVARMMTRMRLIDGVTRVALQESSKADESGGGGSAGGGDCRYGSAKFPKFALVVFFDQVAAPAPAAAAATPTGSTP
jgi:Tfp pilus assembly protein PilN